MTSLNQSKCLIYALQSYAKICLGHRHQIKLVCINIWEVRSFVTLKWRRPASRSVKSDFDERNPNNKNESVTFKSDFAAKITPRESGSSQTLPNDTKSQFNNQFYHY